MTRSLHPAPIALALALALAACSDGTTPDPAPADLAPADPAPGAPAAAQPGLAVSETEDGEDCGCKRRTITPLPSPIRPAAPE